jgi:hypothetical protein
LLDDDPDSLGHGIAELLRKPERARALGAAARSYALARCPWPITSQPLINWVLRGRFDGVDRMR